MKPFSRKQKRRVEAFSDQQDALLLIDGSARPPCVLLYCGAGILIGLTVICGKSIDELIYFPALDHSSEAQCLKKLQFVRAAFELDDNGAAGFIKRQDVDPI